jgi:ankyrin repeat protein
MSVLLRKCGITPLKGWGALQFAAGRGDLDMAKLLLDAGVDVEEMPNRLDFREPGPYTAFI